MKALLRRHSFILIFLALLLGFVLLSSDDAQDIHRLDGYTMGTSYQIQIVDMPAELSSDQVITDVSALLGQLDTEIFSTYARDSELSRFNRHPVNTPFAASTRMVDVLLLAQAISEQSDGAFDITVGPLVNLWGFGPLIQTADSVPEQTLIDIALDSVGHRYLLIDEAKSEITKTKDIYVDLSGIAKGYAVDQLAEYFDESGVENYFLEIGGELKIKGYKPGNVSWVPAVETPLDIASQVYEVFFSRGEKIAVAGSGDYRNYFEENGVRYSHEIDPRNGRPVTHKLAAAYVIDESAARADALATAYMILGLDAAKRLAEEQGQAAYFIYKLDDSSFHDYATDGFSVYLKAN